jgi:predicted permease
MLKRVTIWLRATLAKPAAERDLDDEIRLHLDLETEKNIRAGMTPEEARRQARIAFGGIEATKEAHREARGVSWLEDGVADVRYALRAFRHSPVLATAAVVTLAVGIGANTAIFSAVNAVMLRPLPFANADRLVSLGEDNPEFHWHHGQVAPANMLDWKDQVPAFADVAAYVDYTTTTTLTGEGEPQLLRSAQVTGNFFSVLGVDARLGRTLRPEETWQPSALVEVISDRLWRDEFGADPGIVGRSIELSGHRGEVIGVMPPGFAFPNENVDVWFPVGWNPDDRAKTYFRRAHWLGAVARLKPGVSLPEADAQFQAVVRRLQREYPATNRVMGADMMRLHDAMIGDARRPLLVLLGAVTLVLLIACANVGNLLLVHAAGHEREAALRLALGAGRGRLVRQALTESLVLAVLGGAVGALLGVWGTRVLMALRPPNLLRVHDLGVDWAVLGYVSLLALATGLLFGVAPAVWSGRRLPAEALKEGGRAGSRSSRVRRWGDTLVVAEVALALMLTVGAGLLVRSFRQLERVPPGFDGKGVLTVTAALPGARYDTPEKVLGFWSEIVRRARALPGVSAAAVTSNLPLTPSGWTSGFSIAGRTADIAADVVHREVGPGYFATMRVPLLRGRTFTDADRGDAPLVVVINKSFARKYFPSEDPVGHRIAFDRVPDSTSFWRTIVGVVGDEHQTSLTQEPRIEVIAPVVQDVRQGMTLLLRTAGDPAGLAPAARRLVAELDPKLAIASVATMEEVQSRSLATQRFLMTLLLAFAGVGLLLAVIGVYGVIAQVAKGRTREMGIRIALGAKTADVRWLVVRHGLRLAAAGLAIGLTGALLGTRAMRVLLYAVTPGDPVTFLTVPALLIVTAAAASWLPAARASRADPVTALRIE